MPVLPAGMPSVSPMIDGLAVRTSNSERDEEELVMSKVTAPASTVRVAGEQPVSVSVTTTFCGPVVVPVVAALVPDDPQAARVRVAASAAPPHRRAPDILLMWPYLLVAVRSTYLPRGAGT